MDAFVSLKRRRLSPAAESIPTITSSTIDPNEEEEDSTDLKLAILSSQHPDVDQSTLLDLLIAAYGSVEDVEALLEAQPVSVHSPPKCTHRVIGYQSSLLHYSRQDPRSVKRPKPLTRKGQTLHLYSPADITNHTPCSIIHNFLPPSVADALLRELLLEAPSFSKQAFKLFDNVVTSPHSMSFYVDSLEEAKEQQTEYVYNGSYINDVRQITPKMREVKARVQEAVNAEIATRIRDFYPEGKKLKYQSPEPWVPNAAFVNCYAGGAESVGYHSDQLTYLGPRAVIGSLSLGVAREFRVRKIVPRDDDDSHPSPPPPPGLLNTNTDTGDATPTSTSSPPPTTAADTQGQIALHLPHNSLLIMHAEMQESWKHSIAPARSIDPHPISGNKRINITYRHYREEFHPKHTPRCKCGVATVLRCVQRKRETRGRYMWMCHAGNTAEQGRKGCGWFEWAEFSEDGKPVWDAEGKRRGGF